MSKKAKNLVLASALSFSLLFPQLARAEIRDIKHNGYDYRLDINREREEYTISPDVEEQDAQEILASVFLEGIVANAQTKNKRLRQGLEDFVWQNPSEMNLLSASQPAAFKQNIASFSPHEIPKLDVHPFKRGNELYVKFMLSSQNYVMDWYKDCSIIFLYPKDNRLKWLKMDRIYELAPEQDNLGRFKVREASFPDEREVYGYGVMLTLSKLMRIARENLGKELPPLEILDMAMKIEDQLARESKREREKPIRGLRDEDYRAFEWTPAPLYQPKYEVGRMSCMYFEGKPESIYLFLNMNILQNPLMPQRGTAARGEGPLLELLLIKPSQVMNTNPAGRVVHLGRNISDNIDSFIREYGQKKGNEEFSLKEKSFLYDKIKAWDAQIIPYTELIDKIISKKIERNSDVEQEINQFEREIVPGEGRSLEQILSDYRFVRKRLTKDEQEVASLIQRLYTAYRNKDERAYRECFGKEYQRNASIHDNGAFETIFPKRKYDYKNSIKNVEYSDDGVLSATFTETFVIPPGNKRNVQTRKARYYLINENGRWKIKKSWVSAEKFFE